MGKLLVEKEILVGCERLGSKQSRDWIGRKPMLLATIGALMFVNRI
jgi:hypothetical protein